MIKEKNTNLLFTIFNRIDTIHDYLPSIVTNSKLAKIVLLSAIYYILINLTLLHGVSNFEQKMDKPENLFIGTPFSLQVTIDSNINQKVSYPVKDTIGVFTVLDVIIDSLSPDDMKKKLPGKYDESIKRSIITYLIASFEAGEQKLSPLQFELYDKTTNETEYLSTSPYILNILSVLPDTIDSIKDIVPPLAVSLSFWDYFLPFIALVVIVFLLFVIIKMIRKPIPDQKPELKKDLRPAYIKALELLDNLKKQRLLENKKYVEYHYRLSLILRIFLELNYDFKAVEMTTKEIEAYYNINLKDESIMANDNNNDNNTSPTSEQILQLLKFTDLVKFAKHTPDVEVSLKYTKWLEDYFNSFSEEEKETLVNGDKSV